MDAAIGMRVVIGMGVAKVMSAARAMQTTRSIALVMGLVCTSGPRMLIATAAAQDAPRVQQRPSPSRVDRSASSAAALEAAELVPERAKDARVRFGAWEQGDLDTPARAAEAAVAAWRWSEPALQDASVSAVLRARASLQQGAWDQALSALGDDASPRAVALRGRALAGAGRLDEARKAIEGLMHEPMPAVVRTEGQRELVLAKAEALEPWSVTGRVAPALYESIMEGLGAVRALDSTDWEALLAEARILDARHNRKEAWVALHQALAHHPRLVDAWLMKGTYLAAGVDQSDAFTIADAIDEFSPECAASALLRARASLERGDLDAVRPALDGVQSRAAAQPVALSLRAALAALRFDDAGMAQVLADADRAAPGSPTVALEAGRVLSRKRLYEVAAALLMDASRRAPEWSDPLMELGMLDMQSGQDARALSALEGAVERDPFNAAATLSLRLVRDTQPWPVREGKHFTLRSQPGIDDAMAAGMLEQLDAMHEEVCGFLGHEPPTRTRIDLMPDHEWFGVRLTGLPAIHTVAACTGPVIAMEVPMEGSRKLHMGLFDWLDVVRHEYVHSVTLSQTRNRIPHWLTEALAVDAQHKKRDFDDYLLLATVLREQKMFDFDSMLAGFVRPAKSTDRSQAYAQSHWWVQFIRATWGDDALRRMLGLYATGATESEALSQALDVTKAEFIERFTPWAQAQVAAWGLSPSPSMEELLGKDRTAPISDKELELLLNTHPTHPDLLELAIRRRTDRGESDAPEVIALLERYTAARPVDPFPHRKLAEVYLIMGEDEKAVPHLEYLDSVTDKENFHAIELARIARSAGDGARAGRHIERAVRINPFDPPLRELAAATQMQAGDLDAARTHIVALGLLEPDRAQHAKRLERIDQLISARK